MDFVTGLPGSRGFDAIMTVVDKLLKRPRYAATQTNTDPPKVAKLFFYVVMRHHGFTKVIISDRDPNFTSNFWKSPMAVMGTKLSMTTAHRAQADGPTKFNFIGCATLHGVVSWRRLVNSSRDYRVYSCNSGEQVNTAITF